tara:strand:- start:55 stop:390 length:336 start_codon:yes stop_codon:yes gene_type:complete
MEYVKLFSIIILFMAKGLWLVTTTVTNPAFAEYVEAFQPWVETVGGSVFAKDMDAETVEGNGGKLGVIIEFPSKQAAIDAFNSSEYKELSKLRWANSINTNITIIDGGVTH